MRALLVTVLLCAAVLSGCSSRGCLPESESDTTPPNVTLSIEYTDAQTGERNRRIITAQDSAQTLVATAGSKVVITYTGTDEQGMRRIHLGLTRQITVGVGIQTEYVPLDPVISRCPVARLGGERTVYLGKGKSSISLGLVAENWVGLRTSMPTHVVTAGRK